MAMLAADRPQFAPGSHYLYSDENFEILGELVRRVSGLPLDVYCRRNIFRPLGMRDTGFKPPAGEFERIAPTLRHESGHAIVNDPTARRLLSEVARGEDPKSIERGWHAQLNAFERLRAKYLLY